MTEKTPMNYLEELVGLESVSGNEQTILSYVHDVLAQTEHVVHKGNSWVALQIAGQDPSEALIINGHVDTVPPGDSGSWQQDPYSLTDQEDTLIGLGVTDMKSGIASMLAIAMTPQLKPNKDVWLTFVAAEETDGIGTAEFVGWFKQNQTYKHIAAMVAEPTSLAYIGIGHRGNMAFTITVEGQAGHGSRPHEISDHAIFKAYEVIDACAAINSSWGKDFKHPHLGVPNMTTNAISTGYDNAPNQFPAICQIAVDVRTTPEVAPLVGGLLEEVAQAQSGVSIEELSVPFPPVATSPSSHIVQALQSVLPELELRPFPGATDLSFLQEIAGDCIVFGPGDEAQMHKVNESMPKANLEAYIRILEKLIASY